MAILKLAGKCKKPFLLSCVLLLFAGIPVLEAQNYIYPAFAESGDLRGTAIEGYLDWNSGIVSARIDLNLANTGIRLPTGRMRAEEILEDEFWRLLRPYILSIQVDSSSTIFDLVKRDEISLAQFDRMEDIVQKVPANFSSTLSAITASYTLTLDRISAHLPGSSRSRTPSRPFIVSAAADYTGIVIIADTELPIHGRNTSSLLTPSLHPRIWDTEMNLIFERGMMDDIGSRAPSVFAPRESIFRQTPSGLDQRLIDVVGVNPLRIIARGVFGLTPTDPVIDRSDALQILSTENNRRLLSEGRIAIIVNNSTLYMPFF